MIWWVIYDIAGDKRLCRVSKLCRRAGLRQVQKSVYAGVLSQNQVLALREVLVGEIKSDEDRVLLLPVTEQSINASVTLGIDSGLNDFLVHVSIHSEGDGFVAVSQLLGHAGHISTVGYSDAGKGVTQFVGVKPRYIVFIWSG